MIPARTVVTEFLAAYAHKAWAGWMGYLFAKSSKNTDGSVTIPADLVARWERQVATAYADLPENEKESDRLEAEVMLQIVEEHTARVATQKETSDRPLSLQRLIDRLARLVSTATDTLNAGGDPAAWRDTVARLLVRYSAAAMQAGQGGGALSEQARAVITQQVATQLRFLDTFTLEIQSAAAFQAGWNARAQMYAASISAPYWAGRTRLLPLPALPGDGTTECLSRCRCAWDVEQLDGDNNYNCSWRLSSSESCQSCLQRARDWSPLMIRNGEVQ